MYIKIQLIATWASFKVYNTLSEKSKNNDVLFYNKMYNCKTKVPFKSKVNTYNWHNDH